MNNILPENKIKTFLLNLSVITPFHQNDKDVANNFSTLLGIDFDHFREVLNNLILNKILRKVGYSIRFDPDMLGDYYLAYSLENSSDKYNILSIIDFWGEDYKKTIIHNLNITKHISNISELIKIFSSFIDQMISKSKDRTLYDRLHDLEFVNTFAEHVPDKVLNLLNSYLNTIPKQDPIYNIPLTSDNYAPLLLKMIRISDDRKKILRIIEFLEVENIIGYYDNYKPIRLIKDFVSPTKNKINNIKKSLFVIDEWIPDMNEIRLNLLSIALKEILSGSYTKEISNINTITFKPFILENTSQNIELRERAICILKKMLNHHIYTVQIEAIKIIKDIGRINSISSKINFKELPLYKQISIELEDLIELILQLSKKTENLKVLSSIEEIFIHLWVWDSKRFNKVEKYLIEFPRSIEFIFYRHLTNPRHTLEIISNKIKSAPSENRFKWLNENFGYKSIDEPKKYYYTILHKLNNKYISLDNKISLFNRIFEIYKENNFRGQYILSYWVEYFAKDFLTLYESVEYWNKVPFIFKYKIEHYLAFIYPEVQKKIGTEVLNELNKEDIYLIERKNYYFRITIANKIQLKQLKSFLMTYIRKCNKNEQRILLNYLPELYKYYNLDIYIFNIIFTLLKKNKKFTYIIIEQFELLMSQLRNNPKFLNNPYINKVKKIIIKRLVNIQEIDYYADQLLKYSLTNISELIKFIKYRIAKKNKLIKKNRVSSFDPIPFQELECIKEVVNSFADYKEIMDFIFNTFNKINLDIYCQLLIENTLARCINKETEKLFLLEYVTNLIEINNYKDSLVLAIYLIHTDKALKNTFDPDKVDVKFFLNLSEMGLKEKLRKHVVIMFETFAFPKSWSSTLGEVPEIFTKLKILFQRFNKKENSEELKLILQNILNDIDKRIKDIKLRDQEILNPKF